MTMVTNPRNRPSPDDPVMDDDAAAVAPPMPPPMTRASKRCVSMPHAPCCGAKEQAVWRRPSSAGCRSPILLGRDERGRARRHYTAVRALPIVVLQRTTGRSWRRAVGRSNAGNDTTCPCDGCRHSEAKPCTPPVLEPSSRLLSAMAHG